MHQFFIILFWQTQILYSFPLSQAICFLLIYLEIGLKMNFGLFKVEKMA